MPGDFQALIDNVALLVGGTAVDPVNLPGYYSGSQAGDNTGVLGLTGALSRPSEALPDVPFAVVTAGPFTAKRGVPEMNRDLIKIEVLVSRNDPQSEFATLNQFRDTVPAIFRTRMTIQPPGAATLTTPVLEAFIISGDPTLVTWGGTEYMGWTFILEVTRAPIYVYAV